ncbi:MerR family transcriptional regulator [Sphingosinicella terrae]|jgi:DNA-binding transcriptional MerR regulator|uniref:MerR family transcriptional regulator n=1 Tax=Sphingosinicella terrae TaxID=2172047 RepID=UPI000E0DDDB2|nr:MerR family transcriptional regulator [Sphingosinicella terrae]
MAPPTQKSEHAFRTIGELAAELGLPQHILRYWETRFPQLRPLQRAGNRRYYRPADVALARRINKLLNEDGYTIKGVQQLLARGDADDPAATSISPAAGSPPPPETPSSPFPVEALREIRRSLADALAEAEV